jgi:hypothetical protein
MEQLELMRRFILQEAHACREADPEIMTVFGPRIPDWLHPPLERIGGVHVSTLEDGRKQTIFVCEPIPEYEPTIIEFWEGDGVAETKAVYFCPNAVIVMRPTEEGDVSLIETMKAEVSQ